MALEYLGTATIMRTDRRTSLLQRNPAAAGAIFIVAGLILVAMELTIGQTPVGTGSQWRC